MLGTAWEAQGSLVGDCFRARSAQRVTIRFAAAPSHRPVSTVFEPSDASTAHLKRWIDLGPGIGGLMIVVNLLDAWPASTLLRRR